LYKPFQDYVDPTSTFDCVVTMTSEEAILVFKQTCGEIPNNMETNIQMTIIIIVDEFETSTFEIACATIKYNTM